MVINTNLLYHVYIVSATVLELNVVENFCRKIFGLHLELNSSLKAFSRSPYLFITLGSIYLMRVYRLTARSHADGEFRKYLTIAAIIYILSGARFCIKWGIVLQLQYPK